MGCSACGQKYKAPASKSGVQPKAAQPATRQGPVFSQLGGGVWITSPPKEVKPQGPGLPEQMLHEQTKTKG